MNRTGSAPGSVAIPASSSVTRPPRRSGSTPSRASSPSDGCFLPYRELDDALGLTKLGGEVLSETRRGMNTRHLLVGLLRQSVFGRLAGYEDVNDAQRLSRVPVMRAIVDRKGLDRMATSTSQMGRFETEWLATDDNLAASTGPRPQREMRRLSGFSSVDSPVNYIQPTCQF